MPRDFYPRPEAKVQAFTGVLAARVAADWEALDIPEETAVEYVATQAAFVALYEASLSPTKRTPAVIAGKRFAARPLETATRALVARLRANPNLPMTTKVDLGTLPRKTTYTRIARPTFAPTISVVSTGPRSVTVRFTPPDRPWARALPKGVAHAAVMVAVGEQPRGAGGAGWVSRGVTARATLTIRFPETDLPPFAKAWVTARFTNPRGQAGPWATPAWAHVPPGVMIAQNIRRAA
jgi:hypothetical protein